MDALFGILQILTVVVVLVVVYRPLGDHMARIFTTAKDTRVERGFYRLIGVDSASEQTWPADIGIEGGPVATAWQLAGVAPIAALDQVALLASSTAEELLSGLTELCDAVASDLSAPWPGEG